MAMGDGSTIPLEDATHPLIDRLWAKICLVVWVTAGAAFGLGPITFYIGKPEWLEWCVAGALAVAIYQSIRLPAVVNPQHSRIRELIAGLAAIFPMMVLGLMWLIFYVLADLSIFLVMSLLFRQQHQPWELSKHLAPRFSLIVLVLGPSFVSMAMARMADQTYGAHMREMPGEFKANLQRQPYRIAALSLLIMAALIVLVYFALQKSLWSVLGLQLFLIFGTSYLWRMGAHEPAASPARLSHGEVLAIVGKLLGAVGASVIQPLNPGVDLVVTRQSTAYAFQLLSAAGGIGPDAAACIKAAMGLRESGWNYVRSASQAITSLQPVLLFAGFQPPPEFQKFANEEFIHWIALPASELAALRQQEDPAILRQSATRLFHLETGRPAWL